MMNLITVQQHGQDDKLTLQTTWSWFAINGHLLCINQLLRHSCCWRQATLCRIWTRSTSLPTTSQLPVHHRRFASSFTDIALQCCWCYRCFSLSCNIQRLSFCLYSRQTQFIGLFVCLVFNGTFSTNRLYRAIALGKYIM